MNRTIKTFALVGMMVSVLAGCSMKEDSSKKDMSKVNKTTEKAVDETKKAADKAKNKMDDSIDNMMTYFTNEGIAYENMQPIEHMDFAAHEGRTFMMNGKTAYLYRVKSDDEDMKKVIKEANDTGMAKVKIDNKEMEYSAMVNGDYLLLFNKDDNFSDVKKAFPNYQPAGVYDTNGTMNDMKGK